MGCRDVCDLVGSTALRSWILNMRQVIDFHTCIVDVISRHHGFVARYMATACGYFGYPQAQEDDAGNPPMPVWR